MKTITISREEYDRLKELDSATHDGAGVDESVRKLARVVASAESIPDEERAQIAVMLAWRAARLPMNHMTEEAFAALMLKASSDIARFLIVRDAVNDGNYTETPLDQAANHTIH